MKKQIFIVSLSLLSLAAVVMLASLFTSPAAAGGNPKASGYGNFIVNGKLRTFSFTAVQHGEDGPVTGQAQLNNRGFPENEDDPTGIRVHWKIDCLKFDGNRAIMSGPLTKISPEIAPLGLIIIFGVEDNGQGKNAPLADRIHGADPYPDNADCDAAEFVDVGDDVRLEVNGQYNPDYTPLTEITGGNIRVKP